VARQQAAESMLPMFQFMIIMDFLMPYKRHVICVCAHIEGGAELGDKLKDIITFIC
jgi:hypothetical protein